MKRKIPVIFTLILLLSGLLFSNNITDAVNGYYQAVYDGNTDAYLEYVDVSALTDEEIQNTLIVSLRPFDLYGIEEYEITDIEYVIKEEYALAQYKLNEGILGTSQENSFEYLMLLHNIAGDWKVVFVKSLEEDSSVEMIIIEDDTLEVEDTKFQEGLYYDAMIYFEGEVDGFGYETEDDPFSCTTDTYCQQNNLGNICADGICAFTQLPYDGGICSSAFLILGVFVFAVLKN